MFREQAPPTRRRASVTTEGDFLATFHLIRPQPALIALLASGYSPAYPCHGPPNTMRTKPIGTGPFKMAEFKNNEFIKLTRNPDYWKKGLPYLDAIVFNIIPDRATAILAFVVDKFDVTFPFEIPISLVKDVKSAAPNAICEIAASNVSTNLTVNGIKPPFDNHEIRRAMLPPPEGVWGMPKDMLAAPPGYGEDVKKDSSDTQRIMRGLGYRPDKRLPVKVSTRNISPYKDPAVILLDQLKYAYIDAELEVLAPANGFPKIARKDFSVGLNLTGSGVDNPDQHFFENHACGSKRKQIVREIDRGLQEDGARPIIFHSRTATCWNPRVKNMTLMVNSIYNGWRFEDTWLQR